MSLEQWTLLASISFCQNLAAITTEALFNTSAFLVELILKGFLLVWGVLVSQGQKMLWSCCGCSSQHFRCDMMWFSKFCFCFSSIWNLIVLLDNLNAAPFSLLRLKYTCMSLGGRIFQLNLDVLTLKLTFRIKRSCPWNSVFGVIKESKSSSESYLLVIHVWLLLMTEKGLAVLRM